MTATRPAHQRILLKLSGEALMGDDAFGINRATIVRMVDEVAEVTRAGEEPVADATGTRGRHLGVAADVDRVQSHVVRGGDLLPAAQLDQDSLLLLRQSL